MEPAKKYRRLPKMIQKAHLLLLLALLSPFPLQSAEARNATIPSGVETLLTAMSDEEKAAQMILVYFSSPEFVSRHGFGGVLIMQNMVRDLEKLSMRLQLLQQTSKIGVLVAIDQEGGRVNRLKYLQGWKQLPSAATMSHWPMKRIEAHSRRVAGVLKRSGIQLNLAPVLDPARNHRGEETLIGMEQRAFGNNGREIVPVASAMVKGYHANGVLTIAKHFPGYNVANHSDHETAISNATKEEIAENAEVFRGMAPLVDGIMMSSIRYRQLDSNPAVLSPRIVGWARTLYPDRLIITDDLWGVALRRWVAPQQATEQGYPDRELLRLVRLALDAGNDILMITYPQKAVLMKQAIIRWMEKDTRLRDRIDRSVRRILMAKSKAGLL